MIILFATEPTWNHQNAYESEIITEAFGNILVSAYQSGHHFNIYGKKKKIKL